MYKIEETEYGLFIVMRSIYAPGEMMRYVEEKEAALQKYENGYSLLVDLRTAIPPNGEDSEILRQSQTRSKDGMIRQALIIQSPVIKSRANQLIISGPIYDRTRIIDASIFSNWEELAMNWILHGIEPTQKQKTDKLAPPVKS